MVQVSDELELADWRRRMAELYADVRRLAATDPGAAHRHWGCVRETLFREHPRSPVPAASRPGFQAAIFPYDPSLRFEVPVEPAVQPAFQPAVEPSADGASAATAAGEPATDRPHPPIDLPMSSGAAIAFRRIGSIAIPFADGWRSLAIYWMEGYAGGLFLPFRDATNGRETYGAGRYVLDTAKGADLGPGGAGMDSLVVDFNFAYQPSCAFDPGWACPLAPPENRLDIPIRAGEYLAAREYRATNPL